MSQCAMQRQARDSSMMRCDNSDRNQSNDDTAWTDAGGGSIVVGLSPGQRKDLVELANPTHRVVAGETMRFTVPVAKTP